MNRDMISEVRPAGFKCSIAGRKSAFESIGKAPL